MRGPPVIKRYVFNSLNMSDISGKSGEKPALKISPDNALGKEGDLEPKVGATREDGGGRRGKSTVSRSQKPKDNAWEGNDSTESDSDSGSVSESVSEYEHEQEVQELVGEVRYNTEQTAEIFENTFAALSAIFRVLPDNKLGIITSNLNEEHPDSEIWLRTMLRNEEVSRAKTNVNNNSEESSSDNGGDEPAAAAAAAVGGARRRSFADAAAMDCDTRGTNINIQQDTQNKKQQEKKYIDEQVKVHMEDLARKRNFIISGMTEEHGSGN